MHISNRIQAIKDQNGETIRDRPKIVEIRNKHFNSVFDFESKVK